MKQKDANTVGWLLGRSASFALDEGEERGIECAHREIRGHLKHVQPDFDSNQMDNAFEIGYAREDLQKAKEPR